jgi:hypothetical protein
LTFIFIFEPAAQYPKSTRKIFWSPNSEPVGSKGNFGALERFRHSPTNESYFLAPFLVSLGRFVGYSGCYGLPSPRSGDCGGCGPSSGPGRGRAGRARRLTRRWHGCVGIVFVTGGPRAAPAAAAERTHPRISSAAARALTGAVCRIYSATATRTRTGVGQRALLRMQTPGASGLYRAAYANHCTTGVAAAWHGSRRKQAHFAVLFIGYNPWVMLPMTMDGFGCKYTAPCLPQVPRHLLYESDSVSLILSNGELSLCNEYVAYQWWGNSIQCSPQLTEEQDTFAAHALCSRTCACAEHSGSCGKMVTAMQWSPWS